MATKGAKQKVILGVSGLLEVERSIDVARKLLELGIDVQAAIASEPGQAEVASQLEAITGNPVLMSSVKESGSEPLFVKLVKFDKAKVERAAAEVDAVIVAPASQDVLHSLTQGPTCPDFLKAIIRQAGKPVVIAPVLESDDIDPVTKYVLRIAPLSGYTLVRETKTLKRLAGPRKICEAVMGVLGLNNPQGPHLSPELPIAVRIRHQWVGDGWSMRAMKSSRWSGSRWTLAAMREASGAWCCMRRRAESAGSPTSQTVSRRTTSPRPSRRRRWPPPNRSRSRRHAIVAAWAGARLVGHDALGGLDGL